MGQVTFSCPVDLVRELARAGAIDAAVETGTYRAEGTLALREAVSRVWTVELSPELHERATRRYGDRDGLTFLQGPSEEVMKSLATTVHQPVLFWLDAHGGMADVATGEVFNPHGDSTQCPLVAELESARSFDGWADSCVLIDDARCFLGPLPQLRAADWPRLMEISDLLRQDCNRYITVLDDIIIAVPERLRVVVDQWWLRKVETRNGRDGFQQTIWDATNPSPIVAVRRLIKSLAPAPVRRFVAQRR